MWKRQEQATLVAEHFQGAAKNGTRCCKCVSHLCIYPQGVQSNTPVVEQPRQIIPFLRGAQLAGLTVGRHGLPIDGAHTRPCVIVLHEQLGPSHQRVRKVAPRLHERATLS